MARDCANCFNCKVKISSRVVTPNHRVFKFSRIPSRMGDRSLFYSDRQALWKRLNTKLVWSSSGKDNNVRCDKDHWLNNDGEIFTYTDLHAFNKNGHGRTNKFSMKCDDYRG